MCATMNAVVVCQLVVVVTTVHLSNKRPRQLTVRVGVCW